MTLFRKQYLVDNDPVSIGMSILSGYVFGYVAGRRLVLFTVPFAGFLESLREICEWCADPLHRTIRPLSLAVLILASATTQDDAAAPR